MEINSYLNTTYYPSSFVLLFLVKSVTLFVNWSSMNKNMAIMVNDWQTKTMSFTEKCLYIFEKKILCDCEFIVENEKVKHLWITKLYNFVMI